jgi:hypothetical protein
LEQFSELEADLISHERFEIRGAGDLLGGAIWFYQRNRF